MNASTAPAPRVTVKRQKSFTDQQKIELLWKHFKQRATTGEADNRLRNNIAIAHKGLARKVAHQFASQCAVAYEDLEQIAMIGLCKASDRFDPTKGAAFTSFAMPYIKGEVLHYLRRHGSNVKVPRRMRELNSAANAAERLWHSTNDRKPTEQELAEQMGIPLQQLLAARAAIANQQAVSLDEQITDIPEPERWTEEAGRYAALEAAWSVLRKNLSNLPESENELLDLVFVQRLTQTAISQRFGMKTETMKRKLERVLNRIA